MRFDLNAYIAQHRASIMGISILMIMLYHQTWFYDGAIWEYSHLTGRWGVDLFLFLSGWGIVHSLRKNTIKKFYVNRCIRLLPICVVSGLLQVFLDSIGFEGSSGFPVVLTCIGMFKWFVMAVCLFYAVSPLLYKALTRSGIMTLLCVLISVLLMKYFHCFEKGNVIVTTLSKIIERFPAYVLGMYVCMYGANKLLLNIVWTCLIGLVSFVCCLFLVYNNVSVCGMHVEILCLLPALPLLCIVGGMATCKLSVFSFVGSITLELYLWHEFIYRAMSRQSIVVSESVQFLISLLMSFIIAIVLHLVINYINRLMKSKK